MEAFTYGFEPLADLLADGLARLAKRSWQESWGASGLHFNPDWQRYQRMEQAQLLRMVAVRAGGALVGYASLMLHPNLHDRTALCAVVQDVFLLPEMRRGCAGIKLFRLIIAYVQAAGVRQLAVAERLKVAAEKGGTGKLFAFLGLRCDERIWTKMFV